MDDLWVCKCDKPSSPKYVRVCSDRRYKAKFETDHAFKSDPYFDGVVEAYADKKRRELRAEA